uniref:Glycosyl transferase n=1 Tax=Thermosporothrix sp. COM3 TaxID=2490863 RepID=A0A455SHL9_9CHLR|nr:glycosyl transferase [Thermosporothrix sp. COM3]
MRLSVIHVVGNSAIGGGERHVLNLVQGQRLQGVQVEVVCPRPGPLTQWLTACDIPVTCIEMVRPWPYDEYILDREAVQALHTLFVHKKPEIVHSHLYPASLHASLAAQQADVPAIIATKHTLILHAGDALVSYITPTHTIAVSQAAGSLLEKAGIPAYQINIIYNGIHAEAYTCPPALLQRVRDTLPCNHGPILGTIARLSPEKGIDTLLKALPSVIQTHPTLSLLLVGDGPEARALRRLTDLSGLNNHVHFLGFRQDISALNQIFDLFVLPSREESCSLALLEAMAAGKAVVATDVGGNAEVLRHGIDGLLITPDDPQALSRALLTLLGNPAQRETMGIAARQRVLAHFTCERMVAETLALYQRLLTQPRRAMPSVPLFSS